MMSDVLLIAAGASAACGSATLRFAWSLPRRSKTWNIVGWGLFAVGALAGWLSAGAWGAAIAFLCGMCAALLLLTHAAITAPAGVSAKASNRKAGMLPARGEALHLGRRVATFFIVCLAAMIVAVGLAIATRALMIAAGASEADANVASLFIMPLGWALLACALLMEERRAYQWRLLLICASPGVIALTTGMTA